MQNSHYDSNMDEPELPEYYKALEVTPSASSQEIKKAYKKLALRYHPDKHKQRFDNNTDIASINNQFILINEAYSVLSHEESRARYDSMRITGKFSDQELSEYEIRKQREAQLMREIMAKKEQIIKLSESFINFSISMGWIMSNSSSFENENKLFSAFEKEISSIELSILEESVDPCEQASSDTSPSDSELSTHYLPEDDIVQIMENPQWILIDKETLILSEFVESHMLIIRSITAIVSPLMMACSYGTWVEQNIDILQRVTTLMTQIIQYLELMIQKDGKEFEPIIIDKVHCFLFFNVTKLDIFIFIFILLKSR
jgi:curved DNA-binding protein CbpA